MESISRYKKIKKRSKLKPLENEKCNSDKEINIDLSETIGPKIVQNILSSKKKLFLSLLLFRVFNSVINQTSYVPDEYWQSVEVAHKWIFNIGYLTWEWLPEIALRSPLYPLIFAVPFKIFYLFGLDNRLLLIKFPLVIHGCLAAIGDFYLYMFSFKQSGQQVAQWVLFNQLINWFTFYSCTRTLINNVEWVLVIAALYEYQIMSDRGSRSLSRKLLFITSICFILRPTGLVVLLPMCVYHVVTQLMVPHNRWEVLYKTCQNCLLIGTFSLTVSLLVEKHFYGRWTCSQWNFLHFNLLTDISQNYGVHPWHWYLSNGIPSMFLTQTIALVISVWSEWGVPSSRLMIGLMGIVLQTYSYLGHKEFRFIFPLMPIGMHLIGSAFARYPSKRKLMIIFLFITQLPMALYMCLIHQRGGLDVVMALGRHIEHNPLGSRNTSVVFLMPCHSTPWSSHIHYNITSRFLTCDPQITGGISLFDEQIKPSPFLKAYDEADRFYEDPTRWLRDEYLMSSKRPLFWIMFEELSPKVNDLLGRWNYHVCKRFFHAHFPTHSRHSNKILVYCANNNLL